MGKSGTIDSTLVIRARDEASKVVSAIESALLDLLSTQKDVAAGSKSSATGIQQAVTALAGLDRAYSQIAGAADKGVDAFKRQEAALVANRDQLRSMEAPLESARVAQERMNTASGKFVGPPTRDAIARYAGVAVEVKNLETQIKGLSRTIATQENGFDRSASTLGDLARQTKLAGAVSTFAAAESDKFTQSLRQQEIAAERVAQVQQAIARSTQSVSGKSAADSASVFRSSGLTDIERQIAATERAQQAERDYAASVRMTEAAMRARARIEGNGGAGVRASETAFAQQLREEEAAAQKASAAEKELVEATNRLRAALNPLGVIQDRLNKELAEADNLYKRGKISATELAAAQNLLRVNADRAAKSLGQQNVGGGSALGLRPHELQNLGYQLNDIVTQLASGTSLTQTLAQQGGQILQIFPKAGGAIAGAFSNPLVLTFAATIGTIVIGMNEAGNEAERLRGFMGQLAASADGSSYGAPELNRAAEALDAYGLSADNAVAAVRQFAKDGVDQSHITEFGQAASDLSEVMGVDLKQAVGEVSEAFTGGRDAVEKLDAAYNFLTASQREQIQVLFDEGRAGEARNLALDIFREKMGDAAEKARGPWASAIRELGGAWREFLDYLSDTAPIKGVSGLLDQVGRDAAQAIRALRGVSTADDLRRQIKASGDQIGITERQLAAAGSATRGQLEASLRFFQTQKAAAEGQLKALESSTAEVKAQGDTVARNTQLQQKANADLRDATAEQRTQKTIAEETEEARRKARAFVDKEFSAADEATKLAYVNQKATEARAAAQKRAADEAKRAADQAERERKERERIAKQTQFISPVAGAPVTSGFGLRKAPKAGASTVHKGIDLAVPVGTAVRAPADGVVIESGFDSKLGKFVYIDHGNNTVSKFGHLSDNSTARKGQVVRQGETFAKSGNTGNSTGAHLHYQVEVNGKPVDPRKGVFPADGSGRFQTNIVDAAADYDRELEKQQEILAAVDRTTATRELDTKQLKEQSGLTGAALLAAQRQAAIEDAIAKARADADKAGIAADDPALKLRLDKLRDVEGAYFDAQHARDTFENQRRDVQQPVDDLTALRASLQQQIQFFQETGQTGMANQLQPQLDAVNARLETAIGKAKAFYTALAGNPEAMAALGLTAAQIDNIKLGLDASVAAGQQLGYVMGIAGQQIAQQFASSAVSALDRFAQSVAEGGNAFKSLGQAFLQFAADFLRQIANMIEQQVIFNLVSGLLKAAAGAAGGGGGLDTSGSGFSTGGFQFHSGGVVGAGGTPRAFNPAWVASAVRYHEGGIAGLRPNEIPAVLERGEEVLTRDDPRHVDNGGGGGAGATVKNIVLFDPAEAFAAALNTKVGEKAQLTHVRANAGAYRSALGL